MAIFTWHNGEVPQNLLVRQVYGAIFLKDGRMLLLFREKNGEKIYSLAGGTPEAFDNGMEQTLRRELIEEVNTTIHAPIPLGYQEVDEENGKPIYAQVRMVAMIDKIGERKPDPDNGKIYGRILTHPKNAIKLLNWGTAGELMINEAMRIAKLTLGLTEFLDKDEEI